MIVERKQRKSLFSFVLSIFFHVLLIALIISGIGYVYHNHTEAKNSVTTAPIMQAVAVNQQTVQNEIAEIKTQEAAKKQAAIAWQQQLQQLALQAKEQRISEQQKLASLQKQQQSTLQQYQSQQQQAKEQLAALQALKQQTQQKLSTLQVQQQQLAVQNQQIASALSATQKALANEQSLVVKERLKNQLAVEKAEQRNLQRQQLDNQISRYETLILNAIGKQWIIPQGVDHHLTSQLLVTLSSDGTVENVQLLQSSGNVVLDRSAITAVFKASPLPVPQNPLLLKQFEQLQLTVKPEGFLDVEAYSGGNV
ncbi:MAG: protein TolA [Gammaproteobacteria bacterium RIFCSPHIGHO2_12_FULL_35_23]|nr:MAG: protein TolA [Gammaproteobacteria bacterium RIFCSPHIGHO2_12_FULL_35_23]